MNNSTVLHSTSFSRMFDTAVSIYVLFLEPLLCLAYVWLMWRIGRSHLKELHSSFYKFFIFTGTAACLNVLMIVSKRTADRYMPDVGIKDLTFNFILFGSHWFSLAHTIGKVLVVATRFTAICYPLSLGDFWSPRQVRISAMLMFTIPALLNSFIMPMDSVYRQRQSKILPETELFHRVNDQGVVIYGGVTNWGMQLTKVISTTGYFFFLILSTPMCAACVYKLREAQRFNKDLAKQERALLIHTVITTTAHMIKSAQQIFWFVTMILGDVPLFDLATKMYNLPNTLTTFVPPILLIITSTPVRNEISCGLVGRLRFYNNNSAVTPSQTSTARDRSTQETTI